MPTASGGFPVTERVFMVYFLARRVGSLSRIRRMTGRAHAQRALPDYNAACPHSSAIDAGNRKNSNA
jgi:hypothetical protein